MTEVLIVPIVEGHGEVGAVPALLHRINEESCARVRLRVNPPTRVKASQFLQFGPEFQRHVALAAAKARQSPASIVLVLLDCEDDCPKRLAPVIREQLLASAHDVDFLVALAYREYETWFLAAAESLRRHHGLPIDLSAPGQPESIRDAKGWISRHLRPRAYDEIVHQLAFTRVFDLEAASAVPSFARLRDRLSQYFDSVR